MTIRPAHRFERGQALPLLVAALIALAAFAALALDGGNLYTEQRRAQAAADKPAKKPRTRKKAAEAVAPEDAA